MSEAASLEKKPSENNSARRLVTRRSMASGTVFPYSPVATKRCKCLMTIGLVEIVTLAVASLFGPRGIGMPLLCHSYLGRSTASKGLPLVSREQGPAHGCVAPRLRSHRVPGGLCAFRNPLGHASRVGQPRRRSVASQSAVGVCGPERLVARAWRPVVVKVLVLPCDGPGRRVSGWLESAGSRCNIQYNTKIVLT
jgi:hypothetical protein